MLFRALSRGGIPPRSIPPLFFPPHPHSTPLTVSDFPRPTLVLKAKGSGGGMGESRAEIRSRGNLMLNFWEKAANT